jgi:hypothetical protein
MSEKKRLRSKHIYTTQVVVDKPCYLHAIYISSSVNQTGDVYCYDSTTSASGTLVFGVDPSAQGVFSIVIPEPGILFEKGLAMFLEDVHAVTVVYSLIQE